MLELNEIKKDLYKSKAMAKFSHYQKGKLYYTVEFLGGNYQFPLSTIEDGPMFNEDESGLSMYEVETIKLSEDLGDTTFSNEIKGSELIRWIGKAIKNEEIKKVG